MINLVHSGAADIIGAITPSTGRESLLTFSRPYLENSYVLLTRKETGAPSSLQQMAGKRLAITLGNPLEKFLRQEFAQINLSGSR